MKKLSIIFYHLTSMKTNREMKMRKRTIDGEMEHFATLRI